MRFELKLAWKYFRARRKSLARFTSFVAIIGIAAGVASLILAQALARGFADEMRDKILANTAHISVSMNDGGEIFNWKDLKKAIEKDERVSQITPTVFENLVLIGRDSKNYGILRVIPESNEFQSSDLESQSEKRGDNGGNTAFAKGARTLESPGHDPRKEQNRAKTGVELKVSSDTILKPDGEKFVEISIGNELARKSGLAIGDRAEIITFDNETARTSEVRVAQIFETGLYEYDSTWIKMSIENYILLKEKLRFTPTILAVSVDDIYHADKIGADLLAKIGETFKILDWQEANRPLFAALSLERKVSFAIISLIMFIAVLNITTTLSLLVNERKLDIAVLRTCGASSKDLIILFSLEGLFLGLFGVVSGVLIGIIGCLLGNYFKLIDLPNEVYSLKYVPFQTDLSNILLISFAALLLCLFATIIPAIKASRIKPLENLRRQ